MEELLHHLINNFFSTYSFSRTVLRQTRVNCSAFSVYDNNTHIYWWNIRLLHENLVFMAKPFTINLGVLWSESSTEIIFLISLTTYAIFMQCPVCILDLIWSQNLTFIIDSYKLVYFNWVEGPTVLGPFLTNTRLQEWLESKYKIY